MAGTSKILAANPTLKILFDAAPGKVTYIGEALPGAAKSAAVWRIRLLDESDPGSTGGDFYILHADGDKQFDNVWDNRRSLSYS
jgi:hypothetical protein